MRVKYYQTIKSCLSFASGKCKATNREHDQSHWLWNCWEFFQKEEIANWPDCFPTRSTCCAMRKETSKESAERKVPEVSSSQNVYGHKCKKVPKERQEVGLAGQRNGLGEVGRNWERERTPETTRFICPRPGTKRRLSVHSFGWITCRKGWFRIGI